MYLGGHDVIRVCNARLYQVMHAAWHIDESNDRRVWPTPAGPASNIVSTVYEGMSALAVDFQRVGDVAQSVIVLRDTSGPCGVVFGYTTATR